MLYNDTIAAIATGMTSSGIGIIRISGSDAFAVAEKIFRPHKKDKRLSEQETYTIHYGTIMDGKETLDEVNRLSWWRLCYEKDPGTGP